jgi:hypothetical protein
LISAIDNDFETIVAGAICISYFKCVVIVFSAARVTFSPDQARTQAIFFYLFISAIFLICITLFAGKSPEIRNSLKFVSKKGFIGLCLTLFFPGFFEKILSMFAIGTK